ncbi:MAG: hypothetical protein ACI8WT_000188 [Clostridium sp.]|jgi:hypothetical protein
MMPIYLLYITIISTFISLYFLKIYYLFYAYWEYPH